MILEPYRELDELPDISLEDVTEEEPVSGCLSAAKAKGYGYKRGENG